MIAPLLAAQPEPPVAIVSPTDYQVFQRQSRGFGKVLIRGRVNVDATSIRATLFGDQMVVPFDRATHIFSAEVPVASGGFYTLTVKAYRSGAPVAEAKVDHVGVGEVFVISGQSNSTNYGEERQRTVSQKVASFNGERWQLADDPQLGAQDHSTKGSFIPPFGDALYERLKVPIGVAVVGHGSTSVRQWLPKGGRMRFEPTMTRFVTPVDGGWESTGQLFDGMVARIRQLGPGGFRALLWHQGESDSHQPPEHDISAEDYGRMMREVIAASRREAGWEFPWFVALVSYHTPEDTACPPIRDAQRALWKDAIALEGPDSDTLTGDNRQNGGKGTHMSGKGLKAHGKLWADKAGPWVESQLR